jgi:hypothetical protein
LRGSCVLRGAFNFLKCVQKSKEKGKCAKMRMRVNSKAALKIPLLALSALLLSLLDLGYLAPCLYTVSPMSHVGLESKGHGLRA